MVNPSSLLTSLFEPPFILKDFNDWTLAPQFNLKTQYFHTSFDTRQFQESLDQWDNMRTIRFAIWNPPHDINAVPLGLFHTSHFYSLVSRIASTRTSGGKNSGIISESGLTAMFCRRWLRICLLYIHFRSIYFALYIYMISYISHTMSTVQINHKS